MEVLMVEEGSYKCPKCEFTSTTKTGVRTHMDWAHSRAGKLKRLRAARMSAPKISKSWAEKRASKNHAPSQEKKRFGIFKSLAAQKAAVKKATETKMLRAAQRASKAEPLLNPKLAAQRERQAQWYQRKKAKVATLQLTEQEHHLNWCPNCKCNLKAMRLALEFNAKPI